jgi:hypothetical protein
MLLNDSAINNLQRNLAKKLLSNYGQFLTLFFNQRILIEGESRLKEIAG